MSRGPGNRQRALMRALTALPVDGAPGHPPRCDTLRRSEMAGLDWREVDIDAGQVSITASRTASGTNRETTTAGPKSGLSERLVDAEEMHAGTRNALRKLWLQQGKPASGLVVIDAAGQAVHPDTISWRFKTLCHEAGVMYPGTIHATRHALGTMLLEKGKAANDAAALLGHDPTTFLKFYALTDDQAAQRGAAGVGELVKKTGT